MKRLIAKKLKIPNKLYHATYNAYLNSIQEKGLQINNAMTNWSDSESAIYLAIDPNIAESFAESAEFIEDDIYDSGIVILEVNTKQLDKNKFDIDPNIIYEDDNEQYSFIYKGSIPNSALKIYR